MVGLHTLAAWALAPWLARREGAAARALHRFAHAEQGSELTLRWAAQRASTAELRAQLLRHALDEGRHARAFGKRAAELWPAGHPPPVVADAEDLHAAVGEARFFAFVTLAEGRGCREFSGYRRAFEAGGDARTAALLGAIVADEQRHESYAAEALLALSGERQARSHLRRVALWEAWRSFRRAGRSLADGLFRALMALLYLTLVPPLVPLVRATRPLRPGLRPPAP